MPLPSDPVPPEIVDSTAFEAARARLGGDFVRLLGYALEDGAKAVAAIEAAMRARSAAAMVLPAERLADEAEEFGAVQLAALCDRIEAVARHCVEWRQSPDELVTDVATLRHVWTRTIAIMEAAVNPLASRVPAGERTRRQGFAGR